MKISLTDFFIHQYRRLNTFNSGQLKNIFLSLFFRGTGVLINFYIFRIGLLLLGNNDMGVWLTISSISSWISFFDFGIGNGIKSKITEAFSNNNFSEVNTIVSTGYFMSFFISFFLSVLFLVLSLFVDWSNLLNAYSIDYTVLQAAVLISLISFAIRLSTDLILVVMTAVHKAYYAAIVSFSSNLISLLFLMALQYYNKGSFLLFIIGVVFLPILPTIVSAVLFFKSETFKVKPSFKFFSLIHLKQFLALGTSFFVIQLMYLVIFASDNLIIAQLFKPEDVTIYNTAYKYFSLISFIFAILITPFWPAITKAHVSGEESVIRKIIKTLLQYWMFGIMLIVLMVFFSNTVFSIWTKSKVQVPLSLTCTMAVYVIVSTWNSIFATYINAVGKIKFQMYSSIVVGVLNIPLCYLFARTFNLGISGVMIATIVCLIFGSFWAPYQYKKLLTKTAKGIWNK